MSKGKAVKGKAVKGKAGNGKATITDVASLAGVSIKTVSRVINREANVREETRAKVLAAAQTLDYQPNQSARGLAGSRSFSIGMLYTNPEEFGYVKDNLFGAFSACRDAGYALLLHPCEETPDLQEVRRFIRQTGVDGLILAAPLCDHAALLALLKEIDMPFAQIAPTQTASGACSVQCEEYDACYALTDYLLDLGHTRIGFIKGDPEHGSSERRYAGFRASMKAHHVSLDRSLVRQGHYDFESGRRCTNKLLDMAEPPTAIMASNDDMAAGVLFAAHERGIDVPNTLSVTGFDDTLTARHSWPPLTTVSQPIVDMSYAAAEMLIATLGAQGEKVKQKSFSCDVVIRGSTASA